jgi:redox-sensing transcriptional repressor
MNGNKGDMAAQGSAVPDPTLRRLPVYHHYLKNLSAADGDSISCTQIAEYLGLVPIQVRKDLAYTGIVGRPKTGYIVGELKAAIEKFLGWENQSDALLFGAGHLGMALLSYDGFRSYGLNILAAVDDDQSKQQTTVNGKKIIPLHKAEGLIKRLHIKIGIIAVPAAQAQDVADLMSQSGIRAIWNFAPVKVRAPQGIIVQHENLASSLAVLSKKLALAS